MDKGEVRIFKAETQQRLETIDQIFEAIQKRASLVKSGHKINPAFVESLAFQLHNFYGAIENLMKLTAQTFENRASSSSHFFGSPIDRMTLSIDGIRPALFSTQIAGYLHQLRSFRSFFRQVYAVQLDRDLVISHYKTAEKLKPLVRRDVQTFLTKLEE